MSLARLFLFLVLAATGAAGLAELPKEGAAMTFKLTSSAFAEGGAIPAKYTCDGKDVSPPLAWSGVPAGAKSLALIVDDPDAPDPNAPKMTWVHWVLYDIPPAAGGLAEGAQAPAGARGGTNDWGRTGYGGPCPPIGRHRYVHKLYALDTLLPDLERPSKSQLEAAMRGHVIAEARLIGTYQKHR
jgi:Raf kinase inhibitor-like YbhB/YbcL family protein